MIDLMIAAAPAAASPLPSLESPFAALIRLPTEMFDCVGDVHIRAVNASFLKCFVERIAFS